ncbi:MAG: response regulator [Candidatus Riflebacteria bacterium]|nr:response regulator [Candidatus Riflebacteria bacterium]
MKVLIVEDDEPSRLFLATVTRHLGHEVSEAADGAAGLRQFEAVGPDLVFSDIAMPVMDGLQMLERIRERSAEAIVIMTTAFGSPEHTLRALRLRANDFLVKPLQIQDIAANLRKYADVLGTRSTEREVVGFILLRHLVMRLGNRPELVGKVADRLMQETDGRIPRPERLAVRLGLVEILLNAIEHGNLGITYEEKTAALGGDPLAWQNLVAARAADPRYRDRQVTVEYRLEGDSCCWTITDEGVGFDWRGVPDPNTPGNLLAAHGRGIMLSRLTFDEVVFEGCGNRVALRKKVPASAGVAG